MNIADRERKGRTARGDRSGSRLHPERLARGDRNGSRRHPERVGRGQQRRNAKLTPDDVRAIRTAVATETHAQLARRYGVSRWAIYQIVHRLRWRHVP